MPLLCRSMTRLTFASVGRLAGMIRALVGAIVGAGLVCARLRSSRGLNRPRARGGGRRDGVTSSRLLGRSLRDGSAANAI